MIWFSPMLILATSPLPVITCSFLFKISNLSPILSEDLSIGVFNVNVELPSGMSTANLELVL